MAKIGAATRRLLRLLLVGAAICGSAHAVAAPRLELTVSAPWKGWSRPGRTTEIDLRVRTDSATRASVDVAAGRLAVRAELDLEPGRMVRLQIPVPAVERIEVSATAPGAARVHSEIGIAPSESPQLGVALAGGETIGLPGFHALALAADDLPRHASAYAGIDALVVDATTLGQLDQRQLAALLTHAARCGRIVVLGAEAPTRRVLEGMGGCGGRALVDAGSLADARTMLERSLGESLPAPITPAAIGAPARPASWVWNWAAAVLASCLAAIALTILFFPSLPALLAVSALATGAIVAWLHAIDSRSQLVVWSEGDAGAKVAHYQAWQTIQGVARTRIRLAVPPQLAESAQPCDPAVAMRFDYDLAQSRATAAEFETRLFDRVSLCYTGSFAIGRTPQIKALADGRLQVRNAGASAWPPGRLLVPGRVEDLAALSAGAVVTIDRRAGKPIDDDLARAAATRMAPDTAIALWALDLGGVAGAPAASKGWLAVSAALR